MPPYLVPHKHGGVLIECGPGSTTPNLAARLGEEGIQPEEITDILLTHIHLDHGGSAGWWARQGARIHVHPVGAPHLTDPERLLASAERIYGDQMGRLWGEFLPVPEDKIVIHSDGETFEIEGMPFKVIDTPGHAYHHYAIVFSEICFTGDIGAVRVGKTPHLRLPMPPPEFNLELWKESAKKLQVLYERGDFNQIAPTHFGIFQDADWHLNNLIRQLDQIETWIEKVMKKSPSLEAFNEEFLRWAETQAQESGLTPDDIQAFEAANPSWMSGPGIYRYYQKKLNKQRASQ